MARSGSQMARSQVLTLPPPRVGLMGLLETYRNSNAPQNAASPDLACSPGIRLNHTAGLERHRSARGNG